MSARPEAQFSPIATRSTWKVHVHRMTRAGNIAFRTALILFSITLPAVYIWLHTIDWNPTNPLMSWVVLFSVPFVLLAISLVVSFWIAVRWFGLDEFNAKTRIYIDEHGIRVRGIGSIAWTNINAIEQVTTKAGKPEALLLQTIDHSGLLIRGLAASDSILLCTELLEAILPLWRARAQ